MGTSSVAVPSVAYLGDDGELVFGQAAVRRAATEPSRVAREFKRRVGDPTPVVLGGTPIPAEMLMARLLAWVVERVTEAEGGSPESLAVTHPANWGTYKLDLLTQAVRHAGLEVDHLVPEPVAAASFYASQRKLAPGSVIAVYDLGGGTFDAAVVRSEPTGFVIVGQADGIERLGGIDFDHAVLRHVAGSIDLDLDNLDRDDVALATALAQLRHACVEGKEALSSETDVAIPVMLPNLHTDVRLTRGELEGMIRPTLEETLVAMNRTVTSAGLTAEDVTAVLLVGGSSRIPLVDQLVTTELGRPTAVDARPKDAIPMGAAVTAAKASAADPAPAPDEATPFVPPTPPAPPVEAVGAASGGAAGRGLPWWLAGAAALLVGAVAIGAFLLTNGDDDTDPIETVDSSTPDTTEPPTTSTTAPEEAEDEVPVTEETPEVEVPEDPPQAPGTEPPAGMSLTVDGSESRWSGSCHFPSLGTSRPIVESPRKCSPGDHIGTAPHGSTVQAVCWRADVSIQDQQTNSSTTWVQLDSGGWMSALYFSNSAGVESSLPQC